MDSPNIHDRTKEREQLDEREQERRDPWYREHFWQGGRRWLRSLGVLIQREKDSDRAYQNRIDEMRLGSDKAAHLERQHFNAIQDDLRWYSHFLSDLDATYQQWRADKTANPEDVRELKDHCYRIEWRILERKADMYQLALDILERHRRLSGGLRQGSWARDWKELQDTFAMQQRFSQQVYHERLPEALHAQRLAWYKQLHQMQAETLQSWGNDNKAGQRALKADMKQVDAMIAALSPAQPGFVDTRTVVAIGVIGVVLGLILVFLTKAPAVPNKAINPTTRPVISTTPTRAQGALSPSDAHTLNGEGIQLLAQGKYDQAILRFQEAIRLDPSFYEPFNNMAFCLYEQDRLDDAITQWRNALALNSESPDANAGMALGLYARGEQETALQFYRKATSLNPQYDDEHWLRTSAFWSERAIADSRSLRAAVTP